MQGLLSPNWRLCSLTALVLLATLALGDDTILRIVEEDEEVATTPPFSYVFPYVILID
jgi:hypothetical protein